MTVVKGTIETEIKTMLQGFKDKSTEEAAATTMDEFADKLSQTIYDAILSATITVPSGIAVQVDPNTGTGATSATATATIA